MWREFEFIYKVVQNAIVPSINLWHLIENWDRIRNNLSECARKRVFQIELVRDII